MNSKEYLEQARIYEAKKQAKQDEIVELKAKLLQGISFESDGSICSTPNIYRNENIILKIMQLEKELNIQLLECVNKQQEIMNVVDQLQEPNEITLCYKRYLQFKSWDNISKEMNYSRMHINRIHQQALIDVQVILEKMLHNVT